MNKRFMQIAAFILALTLIMPAAWAFPGESEQPVRVGLYYGSNALTSANLLNESGYGSGYRFGYFDPDNGLEFVELAYTNSDRRAITMVRTSNVYLTSTGFVTEAPTNSTAKVLGCYHVVLPVEYDDFEEAQAAAEGLDGAFVAWLDGAYQVRYGAFFTNEEAQQAAGSLGGGCTVKGTSAYGVNVVATGTTEILFQFDGGAEYSLGVMPDVTGAGETRTWFKNLLYRGGFQYTRVGGGNLTVSNVLDMDSYVKGVIPFEMDGKWPLEALKAQTVCARTYGQLKINTSGHGSSGFDICNTTHCQVYYGLGGPNTKSPSETSDRAVEETSGMFLWYDGVLAEPYYSSSHGGASEDIYNVWGSSREKYPYLCGVDDPYEQDAAGINGYSHWKKTYTAAQLTQQIQQYGYGTNTSLDYLELTYSERGNVIQVTFYYTNGEKNSITPKKSPGIRSVLGVDSIRFTINGASAASGTPTQSSASSTEHQLTVNGSSALEEERPYVIGGGERTTRVDLEELYVISGSGKVSSLEEELDQSGDHDNGGKDLQTPVGTVVRVGGSSYVIEGAGYGHQLGMSQFGAYAMANRGFTYQEIVKFYYPGTYVSSKG